MKGICLCSGGLDSSLSVIKMLEQGHTVVPMFVDYGQWPREKEHEAFLNVVNWCSNRFPGQVPDFPLVELNFSEDRIGSVWGRGIALAGIATMWAYTHGNDYDFVALGNHEGDVGPDCKPGNFDHLLHSLISEGTKGRISLSLPIRNYTIERIGQDLEKCGLPFDILYSCYWNPPCGYKTKSDNYLCPGCRRKALAMRAAVEVNPALHEVFCGVNTLEGIHKGISYVHPNCKERSYQSDKAEKVGY